MSLRRYAFPAFASHRWLDEDGRRGSPPVSGGWAEHALPGVGFFPGQRGRPGERATAWWAPARWSRTAGVPG